MTLYSLAIAFIGGLISIVDLVCITILISSGHAIPAEMWGLLGSGGGAAVVGGAVATGAAIASSGRGTPNVDRFYRDRTKVGE